MKFGILDFLVFISLISLLIVFIFIIRLRNKNFVHYTFLALLIFLFTWTLAVILFEFYSFGNIFLAKIFYNMSFLGVGFSSATLLVLSIIFSQNSTKFYRYYHLFFIIPFLTNILAWTNDFHHLFYKSFSIVAEKIDFGSYFPIHTIYSYSCGLIGLIIITYRIIKVAGLFSHQFFILITGVSVPIFVSLYFTINFNKYTSFAAPVAFIVLITFYTYGFFRFDLMGIAPIAMKKIVNDISELLLILDKNYSIVNFNDSFFSTFSSIHHVKKNEIIDYNYLSNNLFFPDANLFLKSLKEVIHIKHSRRIEIDLTGTGIDKYLLAEISPLFSSKNVVGVVVLFKDLSHHHKSMKATIDYQIVLTEKEKELKRIIELKNNFLTVVSHELLIPLNVINIAVQSLHSVDYESLSERNKRYLDIIEHNINRQQKLINNIIIVSTHNSKSTSTVFQNFDVVSATRKIVDSANVYAQNKNIAITFSSEFTFKNIATDPDKFERILLNLFSNAVKYSDPGKTIDFCIFPQNDSVCFSVKDNGFGIPDDKQEFIFERFGQLSETMTRPAEGAGIGLYLVKMLVEELQGQIRLASTIGVGSTFTLVLPDIVLEEKAIPDDEILSNISKQTAIEMSDI